MIPLNFLSWSSYLTLQIEERQPGYSDHYAVRQNTQENLRSAVLATTLGYSFLFPSLGVFMSILPTSLMGITMKDFITAWYQNLARLPIFSILGTTTEITAIIDAVKRVSTFPLQQDL